MNGGGAAAGKRRAPEALMPWMVAVWRRGRGARRRSSRVDGGEAAPEKKSAHEGPLAGDGSGVDGVRETPGKRHPLFSHEEAYFSFRGHIFFK